MSSAISKRADKHIPYCEDQGIPYLLAAGQAGKSMQACTFTMGGGGVVTFADNGMMDMADGDYQVIIHNHTDVADEGIAPLVTRLPTSLTISGPDNGDVLDVFVFGKLKGQLGV